MGNEPHSGFISYSHKDTEWLERLRVHLKPSDEPFTGEQVHAITRIAVTIDDEIGGAEISSQALKRRIAAKGYHPKTGKPLPLRAEGYLSIGHVILT